MNQPSAPQCAYCGAPLASPQPGWGSPPPYGYGAPPPYGYGAPPGHPPPWYANVPPPPQPTMWSGAMGALLIVRLVMVAFGLLVAAIVVVAVLLTR